MGRFVAGRAVGVLVSTVLAMSWMSGCGAAPIPQEEVPPGWTLNVHQPGEWWTQPLIPRSVIVQRCQPPTGWSSEPDLTTVTALPPGSSVEFQDLLDERGCAIGWSEAPGNAQVAEGDETTEAGLRRICSASGLPMDTEWRFLGQAPNTRSDYLATAAFMDSHGTVVACIPGYNLADVGYSSSVELSVGAKVAAVSGSPRCPAAARTFQIVDGRAIGEYRVRGAGAVRDGQGRILRDAKSLRIGLAGDPATSSHRVRDGIAIVDAWVTSKATVPWEEDRSPAIEGKVLDENGAVLATCRG